jgi:hypothetical protein
MFNDQQRPTDQRKPAPGSGEQRKAKDNVARLSDMMEQKSDIQDVPVADLPDPEGISGPEDFTKYSSDTLESGIQKLQEMKPTIDNGTGNSSDYWNNYDQVHGLDVPNGYRIVYDSYYGGDHIRVEKSGDTYNIVNGRHRIWLAKQMGIESLPMEAVEVE